MRRDKKIERYFQTEVLTRAAGEIVYPVSARKKKRLSVTLATSAAILLVALSVTFLGVYYFGGQVTVSAGQDVVKKTISLDSIDYGMYYYTVPDDLPNLTVQEVRYNVDHFFLYYLVESDDLGDGTSVSLQIYVDRKRSQPIKGVTLDSYTEYLERPVYYHESSKKINGSTYRIVDDGKIVTMYEVIYFHIERLSDEQNGPESVFEKILLPKQTRKRS